MNSVVDEIKQEGALENSINTARIMINKNFPVDVILELLPNLTLEILESIKNENS